MNNVFKFVGVGLADRRSRNPQPGENITIGQTVLQSSKAKF